MADDQNDLQATMTEGYKVGEKKTVDEYSKLDADDEALNRWKASLGLGSGKAVGDSSDPRKVIIEELALEVPGRQDIVIDLKDPNTTETKGDAFRIKDVFTIQEGAKYQMRIKFRVQHEVISGLKYIQVVKRKGIRVDKSEEMLGSYGPNTEEKPVYTKSLAQEEAPSGLLVRGGYEASSLFTDDDGTPHLLFTWQFKISKSWD